MERGDEGGGGRDGGRELGKRLVEIGGDWGRWGDGEERVRERGERGVWG